MTEMYLTDAHFSQAELNGIPYSIAHQRVYTYNWSIERAITQPVQHKKKKLVSVWREVAKENGIADRVFMDRIRQLGWSEEKAAMIPTLKDGEKAVWTGLNRQRALSEEQLATMKRLGISRNLVNSRMARNKWSLDDAVNTPKIAKSDARRSKIQKGGRRD